MKRDTNRVLMEAIHELVVKNECYDKAQTIMDYYLPVSSVSELQELTAYEFDFITNLKFGGSEGIYLGCYIEGVLDASGQFKQIKCGTYKTLDTSLEAMQIMGELAGSLTYYSSEYVNREIDRYTPVKE